MVKVVMPTFPKITLPKSIQCASACCGGRIEEDSNESYDKSQESIKRPGQDEKVSVASSRLHENTKHNTLCDTEKKANIILGYNGII